jgi:cytochrome c5
MSSRPKATRTATAGAVVLAMIVAAIAAGEFLSARDPGRRTYESWCASCHEVGAHGAPRAGHASDWAPRVARGRETLYGVALNGRTSGDRIMPPRGGHPQLTDVEVKAAVDYLLSRLP